MTDATIKKKYFFEEDFYIDYGAISLLLIATFFIVSNVLAHSHSGIDLTDEGFYLNTISSPSIYSKTLTQFGFIYHPLYLFVDGDIAIFRKVNYLLTYGMAVLLCFLLLRSSFANVKTGNSYQFILLSIVIAISSLLLTCFELPQSPSYNTLTFQSLLIGAAGILLSHSAKFKVQFWGFIVVGFSLWLAFMAKPTTALVFGLITFFHFIFSEKINKSALLIPALIAIILSFIFALAIDGSVIAFVNRLLLAINNGRILAAGYSFSSVLRWDAFPLEGELLYILIFLSFALASLMFVCSREGRISRVATLAICATSAFFSIVILSRYQLHEGEFQRYVGLLILAIPAGGLIFLVVTNMVTRMTRVIGRDKLILAITLMSLPFAYAFGTNRPYWLNAEGASFFWVLTGIVLISGEAANKVSWRVLFPVCGLSIFLSSFFILGSIEFPMRQTQSLRKNVDWISLSNGGNQLAISPGLFDYIGTLKKLATDGGFETGMPIIDLTGTSPGVAFFLNGTAPGTPWLLGGYQGSEAFAKTILDQVPCKDLTRAWVLMSLNQTDRLPSKLLENYGINLNNDYEDLGFAIRPPNPYPQSYEHHLLKPSRTHETANLECEKKLQEHNR